MREVRNVANLLAMSAGLVLRMPLGLLVVYALAIVLWLNLIRLAIANRLERRRDSRARREAQAQSMMRETEEAAIRHEAAEREVAEASEPDPARRLYHLGRKTAKAERDAAVAVVRDAASQAIARVEARYEEIDATLKAEEIEREKQRRRDATARRRRPIYNEHDEHARDAGEFTRGDENGARGPAQTELLR
jgi:hypothetical protein